MRRALRQHRWLIVGSGLLLLVLVSLFAVGMSQRENYLKKAVLQVQQKMSSTYGIDFQVQDYRFSGLTTVVFEDVVLVPAQRDTIAQMGHLAVSIQLWPLLTGDIRIGHLALSHSHISLVKKDSISNYDFLFKKDSLTRSPTDVSAEKNYAALVDGLIKKVFFKIPRDMQMDNVVFSYQDDSTQQRIRIPEASIDGGDFETKVFLNDHDAQWNISGNVEPNRQKLQVRIASDKPDVELPLLGRKFGLHLRFEEIAFELNQVKRQGHEALSLHGGWSFRNLKVKHHRLSNTEILLPEAIGKGEVLIGHSSIEVAPSSTIQVKEFTFSPYIKYVPSPKKELELAIHTGKFVAQHFFDALPQGLFSNLAGVQVAGTIAYDLDFKIQLEQPDSLFFSSTIDDSDLRVLQWGEANVRALNDPFLYAAYDDTTFMRELLVGPANPAFTPLSAIPEVLKTTVLNTEDPFFYSHKGFEEEAFKLSIATNVKARKFKRGASTLSMQLVKNLYLNRNKTMMRKLEEILLVWLMESSAQVPKDRLFEIYLNVIEWGKNVYGIQEAADYYFGKKVEDLNLGESLFLSSIIPRPKTGLASFDHHGQLKGWVQRHFNTYGYIMTKRQQLESTQVPSAYGFYGVQLQPHLRPARPSGLVDSVAREDDPQELELEQEERIKKALIQKMYGQDLKIEETN